MKDSRRLRISGQNPRIRLNKVNQLSVTSKLIWVNVIFFILVVILMMLFGEQFFGYIALKPNDVMQGKYLWTFVTSMFMHAPGVPIAFLSFHLLINMFVLFSLGGLCEKIIGARRYLWFYLAAGIVSGLFFVFLAYFFGNNNLGRAIFGSPEVYAVGASGAIFGIAALFMILTPRLRFAIIFLPFFSLPAYIMIPLVLFVMWGVSSSVAFAVGAQGGIGNAAHFGGFIAGVVYGLYLRSKYPNKAKRVAKYFSR